MSKTSKPRPLSIPREQYSANHDAIFKPKPPSCPVCRPDPCVCTEDGPGQCANRCPRKTPYGDAVCGDCLARSLADGPGQGSDEVKTHYERRRFDREGV